MEHLLFGSKERTCGFFLYLYIWPCYQRCQASYARVFLHDCSTLNEGCVRTTRLLQFLAASKSKFLPALCHPFSPSSSPVHLRSLADFALCKCHPPFHPSMPATNNVKHKIKQTAYTVSCLLLQT